MLRNADYCKGWLSPELYLRRPPTKYEQYRVDRMLKAAAERGVKVNIIVYKEVSNPNSTSKGAFMLNIDCRSLKL